MEDDPISAQAMYILLQRSGWTVQIVGTVADAHAYLDRHSPGWIILDLMLPDGDGTAILARIREQDRDCRVTVTTATGDMGKLNVVQAMNPHALLKKPIEFKDLMNALEGSV